MEVKVTYIDNTSLAPDDIRATVKQLFGSSARVEVSPDSDDVYNTLYFAIQEHITVRQVNSFFDDGSLYPIKLTQLRKEILELVDEAFNNVIKDNEDKLT